MGRAFKGLLRLLRRNQNLLCVVVAFGTTLGLAVVSGYWLFYRAAYVIGGLVPAFFVLGRASLRKLEVPGARAPGREPAGASWKSPSSAPRIVSRWASAPRRACGSAAAPSTRSFCWRSRT